MSQITNTVWGHSQDCPSAINSDFECTCKASTECKLGLWGWCLTHRCFIKECQPDTTTQGDDSKLQDVLNVLKIMPHGAIYEANRYDTDDKHVLHVWVKEQNTKMFDTISFDISVPKGGTVEQIQTKGVSLHSQKDGNKLGTTLDTTLDSSNSGLDSEKGDRGSIEGRLDDSMKDQIEEILLVIHKAALANHKGAEIIPARDEILALFQSQKYKTLERVREMKKFPAGACPSCNTPRISGLHPIESDEHIGFYNKAIDDVLAILEAEQKGKAK